MELVALIILSLALGILIWALRGVVHVAASSSDDDHTLEEDGDLYQLGELAERREMVMQLILSTELDHQTGKITEEDRDRTLRGLKREAVTLMKKIESLGGTPEDQEQAAADLDAHLAQARQLAGDRMWSSAAKLRHGGQHPSEAV